MQIRFLRDYRGAATGENFYEAGTVAALDDAQAQALIAEGVAELVEEPATPPKRGRKVAA